MFTSAKGTVMTRHPFQKLRHIAVLGIALAAASAGSGNANPIVRVVRVRELRALPAIARRRSTARTGRSYTTPTDCSTDYSSAGSYFVGTPSLGDIGAAYGTGVLGGAQNAACDDESGVGAGNSNVVGYESAAEYSFIAGGQMNAITTYDAFVGAGISNEASGGSSFVGSGLDNIATNVGSFVGSGGYAYYSYAQNAAPGDGNIAGAEDSFVGAGDLNQIGAGGNGSFIGGGGYTNTANRTSTVGNQITGADSFIGAGDQNTVAAPEAFIGSGGVNTISQAASYATILGGNRNHVSGEYASILGGFGSLASGAYAIVAGGDADTAGGTLSFVAGYHADAAHNGSFVWSDYASGSTTLKDTAANQFVARSSGGFYFYSNEKATTGVELAPGSGTWASLSDRESKTDIVPLDDASVLAKVEALPVDVWRYRSEKGARHLGPMAQDFYAAFGVGTDDRHITSIDEDGVALAAIKALDAKTGRENRRLRIDNADLRTRLAALEAKVERLLPPVGMDHTSVAKRM
jgi:trimeric autotransporter adhesin